MSIKSKRQGRGSVQDDDKGGIRKIGRREGRGWMLRHTLLLHM